MISEATTGGWKTERTPCPELRQRVVVRAAALVRYLAQHPDLPEGQGGERGRDKEGAGATADMEERRGQQRPQQPCAVQVRLEKGDGVEQVALWDKAPEHRLLHRRARHAGRAMDEGERDERPDVLASRPCEPGEPEGREQADRVHGEQHRPPVVAVGKTPAKGVMMSDGRKEANTTRPTVLEW